MKVPLETLYSWKQTIAKYYGEPWSHWSAYGLQATREISQAFVLRCARDLAEELKKPPTPTQLAERAGMPLTTLTSAMDRWGLEWNALGAIPRQGKKQP